MEIELTKEALITAHSNLKKLSAEIRQLQVEAESGLTSEFCEIAENAYLHSLNCAEALKNCIGFNVQSDKKVTLQGIVPNEKSGIDSEVIIEAETGSVICRIDSPPFLKKSISKRKYFEIFCLDLQQEICKILPRNFKKIPSAYIIYINYFDAQKPRKKQPYYDNDNIAIKAIMDSIIPYICFDDSFKYCDNLYLAQPWDRSFVEIHIVPKGNLYEWKKKHKDLRFCAEL